MDRYRPSNERVGVSTCVCLEWTQSTAPRNQSTCQLFMKRVILVILFIYTTVWSVISAGNLFRDLSTMEISTGFDVQMALTADISAFREDSMPRLRNGAKIAEIKYEILGIFL